jgi:hypothetical protein
MLDQTAGAVFHRTAQECIAALSRRLEAREQQLAALTLRVEALESSKPKPNS